MSGYSFFSSYMIYSFDVWFYCLLHRFIKTVFPRNPRCQEQQFSTGNYANVSLLTKCCKVITCV